MLWLTWRQFRAQAIVAGAALAAAAVALAVTGAHLAALYNSNGLAGCTASCGADAGTFISQVKGSRTELVFYGVTFLLYAVPALIGMFWGAPLVTRELETGTFRLAWNQSVPRARWIAVKLGLIGLAATAAAGLLSLLLTWWASPLFRAAQAAGDNSLSINRLAPPLFGASGIAPVGYAAFAFALGVTVGILVRRTVPAMAITLLVFATVQVFWPSLVREHLVAPVRGTQLLDAATWTGLSEINRGHLVLQPGTSGPPGSWFMSSQPVNASGHPVSTAPQACTAPNVNFVACLASHGIRVEVSYQPASRYWDFQWLETGIFLVLAAGLGGACYWRVRRLS
jgi:hypothetical protein